MITVKDVYDFLDGIAPFSYADKFDNTGLLIGDINDDVQKIMLTLDITNDVADEALNKDCDLIVSHHPLIFDALKSIDIYNPIGRLHRYLINAISFHTNYDMAPGGICDLLAQHLGLLNSGTVLEPIHKKPYRQVSVYVPKVKAESVYEAMMNAGAGAVGNYCHCAFFTEGEGRFMPLAGASPYSGTQGIIEKVDEIKIEAVVKPSLLGGVIRAMNEAHPYEEPACQISDNHALYEEVGYGRLCTLASEMSASELAEQVKEALGAAFVKVSAGDKQISTVAIGSGACGGLFEAAFKKGADALICGEVKQSHWVAAKNMGLTLIDAGHFHTENFALQYLKEQLEKQFPDTEVEISESNDDMITLI